VSSNRFLSRVGEPHLQAHEQAQRRSWDHRPGRHDRPGDCAGQRSCTRGRWFTCSKLTPIGSFVRLSAASTMSGRACLQRMIVQGSPTQSADDRLNKLCETLRQLRSANARLPPSQPWR